MDKKINKKGFTLIELLVVIAIIGILTSIVLVSLNTSRVKSRDTKRIAEITQLRTAINLYYSENGDYPAALNNLVPKFISVLPKDPSTGVNYQYARAGIAGPTGICTIAHLGATLESSDNNALKSDADFNSGLSPCAGGSGNIGFNGLDPVYDLKF